MGAVCERDPTRLQLRAETDGLGRRLFGELEVGLEELDTAILMGDLADVVDDVVAGDATRRGTVFCEFDVHSMMSGCG